MFNYLRTCCNQLALTINILDRFVMNRPLIEKQQKEQNHVRNKIILPRKWEIKNIKNY